MPGQWHTQARAETNAAHGADVASGVKTGKTTEQSAVPTGVNVVLTYDHEEPRQNPPKNYTKRRPRAHQLGLVKHDAMYIYIYILLKVSQARYLKNICNPARLPLCERLVSSREAVPWIEKTTLQIYVEDANKRQTSKRS